MSKTTLSTICRQCRTTPFITQRTFTTSLQCRAATTSTTPAAAPIASQALQSIREQAANEARLQPKAGADPEEPYHMNVYSHKHNTHITFTGPDREVILSFSCGNLGLRKGQRGSFDAAYQLASYTFRKLAEKTWKTGGKRAPGESMNINSSDVRDRGIELIMRGYHDGREAFQKAIMGAEGRMIKDKIIRVTDSTRLKFGGCRSPAVRRLG